jgi:hypothetical protein
MPIPPFDPSTLPAPAQKILAESASSKLKLMAARGVVPGLRPEALVAVVVVLSTDADPALRQQADSTLHNLPAPVLTGALGADLHEAVIDALARAYAHDLQVLARLLRMGRCPAETVKHLAERGSEALCELVATNEERLLGHPEIIAALYLNRATRMSTADRIVELAARNHVDVVGIPAWKEVSIAIKDELIAEPSEAPLPEDELFFETDALASELGDDSLESAFWEDPESGEQVTDRLQPLYMRLGQMTVSQKIRRAMLGSKEERMLLIREQNKVIATAAVRSPLLQEPEVVLISRTRGVSEEVLRIIGSTPEWLKSYQVKRNLVENSKTPIPTAQRLIPHLRDADLKKLARDKNVSAAIQQAARRHLKRKEE